MPRLIIRVKGKTFSVNLTKTPITLGSNPDNSIAIKDPAVADRHCEISWTQKGYILKDLNTETGTYVQGNRIREVILKNKDQIRVGNISITYEEEHQTRRISDMPKISARRTRKNILPYVAVALLIILGVVGYFAVMSGPSTPDEESAQKAFDSARMMLEHANVLIKSPQTRMEGYQKMLESYDALVKILKDYRGTKGARNAEEMIRKHNLKDWAEREKSGRTEVREFLERIKNIEGEDIGGLERLCASLLEKYRDTSWEDELTRARTEILQRLASLKGATREDFYKLEDNIKILLKRYDFSNAFKELNKFLPLVKSDEVKKDVLKLEDFIKEELKRYYESEMEKIESLLAEEKIEDALRELKILQEQCKGTEVEGNITQKIKEIEEKYPQGK